MTLKLQVGKRYVDDNGNVILINKFNQTRKIARGGVFYGRRPQSAKREPGVEVWYFADGECEHMSNEGYDLVSEYVEPDVADAIPATALPADSAARKEVPIASGVIDYFPAALVEIAKLSHAGNAKHNPGQPLHWSRGKSNDHADTIMRHFVERGTVDAEDGIRHSVKLAWRALALLQIELEAAGAPKARGAV